MRFALPLCLLAVAGATRAQTLPKVPANGVVYDGAQILSPDEEASIVEAARRFRENMGAPLRVVTFPTLEKKKGIAETGAALSKAWGMGIEGLLLVVAKRERTAHVEIGEDWRGDFEAPVGQVMASVVVPAMKRRDYPAALVAGTADLAYLGEGHGGGADDGGSAPGGPPAAAYLPRTKKGAAEAPTPDASQAMWLVAALLSVVAVGALAWRRWGKTA